ncbi:MAG TPA: agmatine deiminase family protein [Tepidisphaeraceae bacterium]|jgi:agmatine deiminase
MLKVFSETPAELGYVFPAEWEKHEATWFSWPRPEGISFPGKYHTVPENLARIMKEIAARERVEINVPNGNYEYLVRQSLKEHGGPTKNVRFHYIKTNESWCRDHGPAFLVRRNADPSNSRTPPTRGQRPRGISPAKEPLAVVDWGFNAWGGKYPPYEDDDAVPTEVARELKLPVFYPKIVMEGGAVDFNGAGTILTTEQCLLNKNRNPTLSRKRIEQYLKAYYGQKQVCWLGEGITGDDTDGHIDDLARFINPTTIVTAVEDDPRDENYKILQENLRRLKLLEDQDGNPFNIVTIPMPGVVHHQAQRLPATYVNFYFINGALLVPTYRHRKNDRKALETLQQHLPKHQVIGVDCVELIWGLGAIHCLTQQQPKV